MIDQKTYDRLMSKVVFEPSCGCWIFSGAGCPSYGALKVDGRMRPAHILTFEWFKGPVPEGCEVDHVCRLRCCVNPDHLRALTRAQNLEAAKPFRKLKYQSRPSVTDHGLLTAIRASGSKSKLAAALSISREAVCVWKRVPTERIVAVENVTRVPRSVLRPDLYPLEGAHVAA